MSKLVPGKLYYCKHYLFVYPTDTALKEFCEIEHTFFDERSPFMRLKEKPVSYVRGDTSFISSILGCKVLHTFPEEKFLLLQEKDIKIKYRTTTIYQFLFPTFIGWVGTTYNNPGLFLRANPLYHP